MRRNPKKGGQFAIIWVDLLYEDSVPATAKILFGEIYRLSGPDGWCDASNQDFMDLLGCSETTVRNLLKALEDAGVGVKAALKRADPITKLDLFELGLSGGAQSAVRRAKLMKRLELPEHLSANALVTVLASLYSREELYRLCASLFGEGEQ